MRKFTAAWTKPSNWCGCQSYKECGQARRLKEKSVTLRRKRDFTKATAAQWDYEDHRMKAYVAAGSRWNKRLS